MTISSSLAASVSGLAANATKLATISDNIANSSTPGFKRSVTEFTSLVVAGGNESGTGFVAGGVQARATQLVDEGGAFRATSNPTDLAVAGRGFLPVTTSAALAAGAQPLPLALTTTGSFRPDANGVLVTSDGRVLLGVPAAPDGTFPGIPGDSIAGLEPVQLDFAQISASATTEVSLQVNLPADATVSGAPGTPFDLPLPVFDALGNTVTLNFSFQPQVPAAGASNIWTLTVTDDPAAGAAVLGSYELTFASIGPGGGGIASVTTLSGPAFDPVTGTLPLPAQSGPVDIVIGQPGSISGLSQFADAFRPISIDRNGAPPGTLSSVRVGEDGVVTALFNTGVSRAIARIPLVDVANPNGLKALGAQSYEVSAQSGPFRLVDPGAGGAGAIFGFVEESSTTDIAAELTQLIETQRAYSSNATVVRTVDEILQETTNLKR